MTAMIDARITFSVALVLSAGAAGCGGASDGLVAPQSLAELDDGALDAGEGGRFLSALLEVFDHETCAVRVVVGTRTVLYDDRTEAQIAALSDVAHEMCAAGIHEVSAGYDELGEPEVTLGARGRASADGVTFAVSDAQPWTFEGVAWSRAGRATCGGTLPAERDHVVRLLDDGLLVVEIDGEDVFPVAIERGSGMEICPTRVQSDPAGVVWLQGPGEWDVYVASSGGTRGAWEARVSPPDELERGPTAASGTVEQVVALGPYTRDAWSEFSCTGYIGSEPTLTYWNVGGNMLTVEVSSQSDPVLVVIGPNGQISCNDDTNGLDPAVYGLQGDGMWDIYVGTYSMSNTFDATLTVRSQ